MQRCNAKFLEKTCNCIFYVMILRACLGQSSGMLFRFLGICFSPQLSSVRTEIVMVRTNSSLSGQRSSREKMQRKVSRKNVSLHFFMKCFRGPVWSLHFLRSHFFRSVMYRETEKSIPSYHRLKISIYQPPAGLGS